MTEIVFSGCHPEPLGSYLKALGLFRIVAEQLDHETTSHWDGDHFVLVCPSADLVNITDFLLDRYQPSPLVSPWNGGSGFGEKDQQAGIAAIETSTDMRYAVYRDTIAMCRSLVQTPNWESLEKHEQVSLCRNALPDEAVRWIDAAVVLTTDASDGRAAGPDHREFPPLLGTGGNVGRLEFSNNYMQRLVDALSIGRDVRRGGETRNWLDAALTGVSDAPLLKAAIGQFDPGGAGGANSDPLETSGTSLVNPWDFIFSFEGTLLFASGAARRWGSSARGRAAMPFMVDATPIGYSSGSDAEGAKGELWAPLWTRPAGLSEIDRLLSEGRAEWGGGHRTRSRSQARTGLDFARSVAALGVDRGVEEFVRHSFLERHGQNMLAVPLGRFHVRHGAGSRVLLTAALDPWIERINRVGNRPKGVDVGLRRLQRSIFELAQHDSAQNLQTVLIDAGRLDGYNASSLTMRGGGVRPLRINEASEWVNKLGFREDGAESAELRLAVAFTSQRDRQSTTDSSIGIGGRTPGEILRPINLGLASTRGASDSQAEWRQGPSGSLSDTSDVVEVLGAFLDLRCRLPATPYVTVDQSSGERTETGPAQLGAGPAFDYRIPARLDDVLRFLLGQTNDVLLLHLIRGCLLLDFASKAQPPLQRSGSTIGNAGAPPAFALFAPFFTGRPISLGGTKLGVLLNPAGDWPRRLRVPAGSEAVVKDGLHRLRVARLIPLLARHEIVGRSAADSRRLAAALAFPLDGVSAAGLLERVACRPDDLEPTRPSGDGTAASLAGNQSTNHVTGDSDE